MCLRKILHELPYPVEFNQPFLKKQRIWWAIMKAVSRFWKKSALIWTEEQNAAKCSFGMVSNEKHKKSVQCFFRFPRFRSTDMYYIVLVPRMTSQSVLGGSKSRLADEFFHFWRLHFDRKHNVAAKYLCLALRFWHPERLFRTVKWTENTSDNLKNCILWTFKRKVEKNIQWHSLS